MSLDNRYRSMNESIAPDSALVADTLSRMEQKQKRPTHRLRRVAAVAAAAALAVGCCTPALAANVPAVYETLYAVSPAAAQFFMPVNEVCEDNGVRMEVVSAAIYGDTAEIYLTMQDTTGELFDGTLDLYDSYSLNVPVRTWQSSGCTLVDYDTETSTATFLLEIKNGSHEQFTASKYTFSVKQLLTGRQDQDGILVDAGLSHVPQNAATERHDINGASYMDDAGLDFENGYNFLMPQGTLWQSGDGVFTLAAAGYRDGRLHLMYSIKNALKYDNHGWFPLYTADGSELEPEYTVSYRDFDADITYDEFVYNIAYDELPSCTLTGNLFTSNRLIEGNWQVTFRLPEITQEFAVEGETEQQDAALFNGQGYTVYIPSKGWRMEKTDGADIWRSTVNDAVSLRISRCEGQTASEAREAFVQASGFVFGDPAGGGLDDPLTGTDGAGNVLAAAAVESKGTAFVVSWQYPEEAAEGFGARLAQIAGSFLPSD